MLLLVSGNGFVHTEQTLDVVLVCAIDLSKEVLYSLILGIGISLCLVYLLLLHQLPRYGVGGVGNHFLLFADDTGKLLLNLSSLFAFYSKYLLELINVAYATNINVQPFGKVLGYLFVGLKHLC